MGNENFDASMLALVERAANVNHYSKEEAQREVASLVNVRAPVAKNLAAANYSRKAVQLGSLLVFESSQRFMSWYDHLEGRYFDSVQGYQNPEELVNARRHSVNARCVILEIRENKATDTSFVQPILASYPNADIILTVPGQSSHFFSDIVEYSERVKILERPFSMSSLVGLVREITAENKRSA